LAALRTLTALSALGTLGTLGTRWAGVAIRLAIVPIWFVTVVIGRPRWAGLEICTHSTVRAWHVDGVIDGHTCRVGCRRRTEIEKQSQSPRRRQGSDNPDPRSAKRLTLHDGTFLQY
jgi:hypothetical protein